MKAAELMFDASLSRMGLETVGGEDMVKCQKFYEMLLV